MERDIVGLERQNFFNAVDHITQSFAGQSEDQIHVDRPIRRRAELMKRANDILGRMSTTDPIERPLLHRLRIDAHPPDAELFHHLDL